METGMKAGALAGQNEERGCYHASDTYLLCSER